MFWQKRCSLWEKCAKFCMCYLHHHWEGLGRAGKISKRKSVFMIFHEVWWFNFAHLILCVFKVGSQGSLSLGPSVGAPTSTPGMWRCIPALLDGCILWAFGEGFPVWLLGTEPHPADPCSHFREAFRPKGASKPLFVRWWWNSCSV